MAFTLKSGKLEKKAIIFFTCVTIGNKDKMHRKLRINLTYLFGNLSGEK